MSCIKNYLPHVFLEFRMPPKGRGRPATNTGQATSILGDLQALSSDDLENLKDVKVSFTCKKCGAKSPTLKSLISHLSTDCKVGLANTSEQESISEVKLNEDGTPKRGRGRPRKVDTCDHGTVDEQPSSSQPKKSPTTPQLILPEAVGRVTRISSGSLKRKSATELLNIKVEGDDEDEDEDYDDSQDDEDFRATPRGRGRGRPRKYPRADDSYEYIEHMFNESGKLVASF